jgi:NRPS condensation-like uncharacterized protein
MPAESIPERFPAAFGDIVSDAMDPMLEMVLGSRLRFADRLDPDVLARAARLLLDLEPVLGCWWDESFRGADWVRCADLDDRAVFEMAASDDPDRDSATFHGMPFDPKGPRLAVLLLRSTDHDDLCVRFDHRAGDGWSAMEVTHLLAETYTRVLDDPGYAPSPRATPRPTGEDVWAALTDEQRRAATDDPPPMMNASQWMMKARRGRSRALSVRTLTLAPERVAAIREYAHARGGTVNDALLTALLRTVDSVHPQKSWLKPGVSISADTRRFARGEHLRRPANIATTQTVRFDYRSGETFDQTLRHVIDGVRPYKEHLWSVRPAEPDKAPSPMACRAIFRFSAAMIRATRAAALLSMNLGPFEEKRLVFGRACPTAAIGTGPVARFAGFPLLVSYYRGALTVWTGCRENRLAPELVERYMAGIDSELEGAVRSAGERLVEASSE